MALCNPMDCSTPGFSVYGILQARILEWVTPGDLPDSGIEPVSPAMPALCIAGRFFTAEPLEKPRNPEFSSVQSLRLNSVSSSFWPHDAAHQASLSITNSQSLLKLMSIELVVPSNHLILRDLRVPSKFYSCSKMGCSFVSPRRLEAPWGKESASLLHSNVLYIT